MQVMLSERSASGFIITNLYSGVQVEARRFASINPSAFL